MWNPSVQEGGRFFSYTVSGLVPTSAEASGFPFTDTTGARIKCNYARVTIHYDPQSEPTDHVAYFIEPSALSYTFTENSLIDTPHPQHMTFDDVITGGVSGFVGMTGIADLANPNVAVFKCQNGEVMDSLNIHLHEHPKTGGHKGKIYMSVMYGNITPFNTLRLDKFSPGI